MSRFRAKRIARERAFNPKSMSPGQRFLRDFKPVVLGEGIDLNAQDLCA